MGLKLQTYYAALRFDIVPGGFSPRCALLVADRLSTATSKQPSWSAEILLHAAMFLPTAMLHYLCSLASYSRTAATLPPTPLKVGWAHMPSSYAEFFSVALKSVAKLIVLASVLPLVLALCCYS